MMRRAVAVLALSLASLKPAGAYIDGIEIIHPEFFTLAMLYTGNVSIVGLTVQRVDGQAGKFLCEPTDWLKGRQEGLKFKFGLPLAELKTLQPGSKGVLFFGGDQGRDRAILFLERHWILVAPMKEDPSWWGFFRVQPEIKCVFMGSAEELGTAIRKLEKDGEVVVSCQKEPRAPELQQMRYFMNPRNRRRLVPASGQTVAQLLQETGKDPKVAVPTLAAKLKDPDGGVRGIAMDALATFGPLAKDGVPALAETLKDPERINRWAAAEALSSIGAGALEAVPALTRALTEKYPMAVESIRRALPRIDPRGEAVLPILLEMLQHSDPAVRWSAAEALKQAGGNFRPTAAVVEQALKHPSGMAVLAHVNLKSAELAKGELGKAAAERLTEALKSKEAYTRSSALGVLTQVGGVDQLLPAIRAALDDAEPGVRRAALSALMRSRDVSVPLAAIRDRLGDREVAAHAIDQAARLGPKAESLVAPISDILLKGTDGYLRFLSAGALGKICVEGKPEHLEKAVPALVAGLKLDLKDQYQGVASVSAEALSRLGPVAKAAAPALLEVIREKEENPYRMKVRLTAAEALARTDRAQADVAVAYLIEVLQNSPNPGHRLRATVVLGEIGPDAKAAVAPLTAVLAGSPPEEARSRTAEALKRIQGK